MPNVNEDNMFEKNVNTDELNSLSDMLLSVTFACFEAVIKIFAQSIRTKHHAAFLFFLL